MHSVHRGQKPGNLVKAVHRPRTTHDSSCRYMRDGYYCCCRCRCCKPITIAVPFFVFVLPLFHSRLSQSLPPTPSYTPSSCLPMTTLYPSSPIDLVRFSLVPIYPSFPPAEEVTGYLAAVDREIYVVCYERVRVTISSRCWSRST